MLASEFGAQRVWGCRRHRPHPQRVIHAPREQFRPVGAEVQADNARGVTGERGAELGSVADIPQPDAAVTAARRERAPVGAERCDGYDGVRVHGVTDGLEGAGVPQPQRAVHVPAASSVTVAAERDARDVPAAGHRLPDGLAGAGVPQPDGPIEAAGGHDPAVGAEADRRDQTPPVVMGSPTGRMVAASHS